MKNYSQKDKRWAKLLIGSTNLSMKYFGCFVVALSIIDGRTPAEVLNILNRNNAFNSNGMLISEVAAKALGLSYDGYTTQPQKMDCIAETDHFKKDGFEQHFFVLLKSGKIIDPLDGRTKDNPYNIVSYRLFSKKPKPAIVLPPPFLNYSSIAAMKKEFLKRPNICMLLWERIKIWIENFLNWGKN